MPSRTVSQNTTTMSTATFNDAFTKFAPSAWMSFQKGSDIKVWAREEARRFVHTVPGSTFLPVWYNLISYADTKLTTAEEAQKMAGTFPAKRTAEKIVAAPAAAAAAAAPSSVVMLDRGMLNHILFREVNALWDAFQMEGYDEDGYTVDKNGDSPIGTERFVWHCSKVLARKQQASVESMVPIVEAWLSYARATREDAFV